MNKSLLKLVKLSILILSNQCFPQEYITELPKEKNQLFWLLKVKVEIIQEENFRTTDSSMVWNKITKNYYDPGGYLVKKEIFDSSFTLPSLVNDYKYDKNGNYTEFFLNGKLRERREYNDFGKITHIYYYSYGNVSKTHFYKYDSNGNEIEILIKYSSGKIDTFVVTHYNYDLAITPPRIISDTTYFRELGNIEIFISESDSIGRCTKSIVLYPDSTYNYTTLYFYNDKNLFDSTIQYSNKGVEKYIRRYDKSYRLTKTMEYTNTDSNPYIWNFFYDDNIFITIDSLFQKNNLDLAKLSDFEMTGVVLETLQKGENEIRVKIITQYYSNGLLKNTVRLIDDGNKIEKKFYDYEYYDK